MAGNYLQKREFKNSLLQKSKGDHLRGSIKKMAVLFTDIVGSSKYFKEYGDVEGRKMLKQHQDLSSPLVTGFGGFVVKLLGDSVMAYFLDPNEALKAAIKIQKRFRGFNCNKQKKDEIHIRICIHFGDGIEEEKEALEAKSILKKIKQLSGIQSYFGSIDMIHYAETLINMGKRSISIRKKKISRMISDLEDGLKKHESHVEVLNYHSVTQSVLIQIKDLRGKLDRDWDVIESCDAGEYKKILNLFDFENIFSDLGRIKSRLEKLDTIVHILRFVVHFLRKSIFIQSVNLIIALIVFPIIVHYLNFILPNINILPRDIWYYQKLVFTLGALIGLILASLMSRAEPSS